LWRVLVRNHAFSRNRFQRDWLDARTSKGTLNHVAAGAAIARLDEDGPVTFGGDAGVEIVAYAEEDFAT
jgi:hypothetical protein